MGSSGGSVADIALALEGLDAEFVCGGKWRGREPVALVLPTGERLALEKKTPQKGFIRSLLTRSEPAPFGDAKGTRTDPSVRHALRVAGRGDIVVDGFDPRTSGVLDIVERELSPYAKLAALLTDVLIYPTGGHFAVHKDTPRSEKMLGTLVVGLPIPHEGGTFELRHGGLQVDLSWGNPRPDPTLLSWAAFYGDVDHRVLPVTDGTRITLTYELRIDRERRPGSETPIATALRRTLECAVRDKGCLSKGGRLFVPSAHMLIAGRREKAGEPLSVDRLRGRDRHLAAILAEVGLGVTVRPCLAIVDPPEGKRLPSDPLRHADWLALDLLVTRKAKEALGGWVVLEGPATGGEDGEEIEAFELEEFGPEPIGKESYVTRDAARAEFLAHTETYSSTGYFGNEFSEALFYTFAAIEVNAGSPRSEALGTGADNRVVHRKFGEGTVLGERTSDGKTILDVLFGDGQMRTLEESYVERLKR